MALPPVDPQFTARARERLVFALDINQPDAALSLARRLKGSVQWIKVATRLYTTAGPNLVRELDEMGFRVFLDLKFHDIPDQVEGACAAAARLGVGLITVHASGGRAMLEAAARGSAAGAAEGGRPSPCVLAVTVLTSLGKEDLDETGVARSLDAQVLGLAELSRAAGVGGIVASPKELPVLRQALPSPFRILTPGIRPAGAAHGDQKRVMSPEEAVSLGADWLVVGRPIRQAPDPVEAADAIVIEMARGEAARASA